MTSRNNLAHAYRSAGDLQRAIPLFEAALTQCKEVLGDTHRVTLIIRDSLDDAVKGLSEHREPG
ncbi:tetratricopeptide repeat protein [Streptomyces sp. NPDC019443]|uniref:tetratricopeptide repeat protein n=1 Tax=Streptomyces sp. NPDC019443 TaxID=3365061 RepID=UPI00379DBD67